jgi:hypothetical protein
MTLSITIKNTTLIIMTLSQTIKNTTLSTKTLSLTIRNSIWTRSIMTPEAVAMLSITFVIYLLKAVPNVVVPSVILMSVVAPLITLHGSKHTTDGATYYAVAVSYMCKMLMKLTTGINVIKLLSSSLMLRQSKLVCFSFAGFLG